MGSVIDLYGRKDNDFSNKIPTCSIPGCTNLLKLKTSFKINKYKIFDKYIQIERIDIKDNQKRDIGK
jgi:hypothetical protein